MKFCETITECDDEDDDDAVDAEDESNCQDVSSNIADVKSESASVSPSAAVDQSDEELELETSKSKLPKSGLRIKLSLKPVRKSMREHKAPVSIWWLVFCKVVFIFLPALNDCWVGIVFICVCLLQCL